MSLCNILIIDHEIGVLNALERTFRRECNVFSATNGEDALSIMEQNNIALIIADHRVPAGMNGIEFLEQTSRKYPNTVRIILTAYIDDRLLDAINKGHVYNCITKPWEPEEIRAIVREGIKAYCNR